MRKLAFALFASFAVMASGCTTTPTVQSIAAELSGPTSNQVKTLAGAVQAATLATKAVDLYVTTAHPPAATLNQLKSLNDGVHKALTDLEAANTAGQSLAFAVFNEALAAFQSYAATKGVKS